MALCYSLDHVRDETNEEQQQYSYAVELALSPVLPFVLKAVVELQVFDIIAKAGPGAQLSPSQIASQLPPAGPTALVGNPDAPEMLDRMLRLLASHSILTCSVIDHDSPAPALDRRYQLKGAVLEGGIPFHKVHGIPAFEYSTNDPRFSEVFNKAMIDHSAIVNKKILESSYKGFEQVQKLVDVGGGLGATLKLITSKYPHITAVNFDLPHWILHNWSDDHCLKLLKNCYKALPENGKVIVVDGILPVMPDSSAATKGIFQMDLQMMAQLFGGKERTQQEFLALATGAGFSGIRLECLVCDLWIMEFYK
ncbi:hypothetical protein RHGRI_000936 [Rhododendron griersonianum]|uniref:O-methyltransferase C-terminal domain-containing protein n=1 Tax=Rhododendron griersonianum TaxID=479676 RepID=A0AAV6LKM4_9ERIC|nr:hypothetical protein RHGRI_000936 [Rhododendron griersonianum]